MQRTYAVTWEEPDGRVYSGKLEVRPRSLRLEGSNGDGGKSKTLPLEEVVGLRVGRTNDDRLAGRPSLVLQLHRGSIKIASVAQPGILSEIGERIASLSLGRQASSIAIVLPIKAEAHTEVAKLVRRGPPFDPEAAGIDEHRVFLTDREAVFVFESAAAGALERLVGDANVLAAAAAWRDLLDGPPRLAELGYSWIRPVDNSISFEPTPGPGDSDGGDLFTP